MEIFSVLLFSTEICKYFHPSIFMGHILNSIFSSLLLTNLSYKMELLKQIHLLSESLQHLPQFGCCKPADNLHFCRVHMIWFKSGAPPKDSFHGRCAAGGRHQGSHSLSLLDSSWHRWKRLHHLVGTRNVLSVSNLIVCYVF